MLSEDHQQHSFLQIDPVGEDYLQKSHHFGEGKRSLPNPSASPQKLETGAEYYDLLACRNNIRFSQRLP
jgi:hypothetical protein